MCRNMKLHHLPSHSDNLKPQAVGLFVPALGFKRVLPSFSPSPRCSGEAGSSCSGSRGTRLRPQRTRALSHRPPRAQASLAKAHAGSRKAPVRRSFSRRLGAPEAAEQAHALPSRQGRDAHLATLPSRRRSWLPPLQPRWRKKHTVLRGLPDGGHHPPARRRSQDGRVG